MTDELDVETQRRHIREMFRLLELKQLAAANAIDAAQQRATDATDGGTRERHSEQAVRPREPQPWWA